MPRDEWFSELISPIGADEFFFEYWEKKPLILHRHSPEHFRDLLSLDAVDAIIASSNLRLPSFRLVKDGTQLPIADYTKDVPFGNSAFEGVLDIDKALSLYRDGATIVIEALQRFWPPVSDFCRTLEKRLTHSVQANAYLTPRGSQGFKPHYDTHDVFILQVSGAKRWRLFDSPLPLPHSSQKFDFTQTKVGECESEFDLDSGDMIYIPRGFIHEGLTTDSHSLHITIGVPAMTLVEVFSEAIKVSITQPEFRKSLPVGFAESSISPEMIQNFRGVLQEFIAHLDLSNLFEIAIQKYLGASEPERRGSLVGHEASNGIHVGTQFIKRPQIVRRVLVTEGDISLLFEGKKITFPSFCHSAISRIDSIDGIFSAEDLPEVIDIEGRVVLLQRLFDEGYLCRANGSPT